MTASQKISIGEAFDFEAGQDIILFKTAVEDLYNMDTIKCTHFSAFKSNIKRLNTNFISKVILLVTTHSQITELDLRPMQAVEILIASKSVLKKLITTSTNKIRIVYISNTLMCTLQV